MSSRRKEEVKGGDGGVKGEDASTDLSLQLKEGGVSGGRVCRFGDLGVEDGIEKEFAMLMA